MIMIIRHCNYRYYYDYDYMSSRIIDYDFDYTLFNDYINYVNHISWLQSRIRVIKIILEILINNNDIYYNKL